MITGKVAALSVLTSTSRMREVVALATKTPFKGPD